MGSVGSAQCLDTNAMIVLANFLGESPETVHAVHALRRQYCQAYIVGDFSSFQAALIQIDAFPTEPQAFGSDPEAIWDLLQLIQGWDCVNVDRAVVVPLGNLIQERLKTPVRYYNDSYYILSQPAVRFLNKQVRRLKLEDHKLLESAPKELRGHGYGTTQGLLKDGIVACAIVSGKIVSIAHTAARSKQYGDIGVFTQEKYRGNGFATAAASIVTQVLQQEGQIPVWSAGDDNFPSIRIARKLGFSKVSQRQYIILDKLGGNT